MPGTVAPGAHPGPSRVKRNGDVEAVFSPARGGRLDRLRHRGVDLVLPPGRVAGFHGETFWPSPQALWDWPPPAVLDAGPYAVLAESPDAISMRSAPDPAAGVRVGKQYRLLPDGMDITFTVTNTWPGPHALAPWQVTRAPRSGLLVWAAGDPFTDEDRLVKQREDPGCWYVHARGESTFPGLVAQHGLAAVVVPEVDRTCKLFADARGWLAHVHDATVLLRTFPDLAPDRAAPRQAEVELFFSPERDYIELENQGAHEVLQPGATMTYPVQLRLAALAPDVPTDRVTPALVAVLASLLGKPPA
jgi:hypothetical protein